MSESKKNVRIKKSIKLDKVSASDFNKYNLVFCCEQCTHFGGVDKSCSIGYKTEPHLRDQQIKRFEILGAMAFCRFCEID